METPEYITLTEAAKRCPSRPSISAIWRWCRRGLKSRSGRRVRLQHVRVGGRIFTTEEYMHRFFGELAASDAEYFDRELPVIHLRERTRGGAERRAAIRAAKTILDEAGI